MAGFTDAYELVVLDATFADTNTLRLSLTGSAEMSKTGYSAQTITWAAASAGTKSNSAVITFGPAGEDWGSVPYFAVYNAAGTQMTDWTALTTPKTVSTGDSLQFAIGALDVTLD